MFIFATGLPRRVARTVKPAASEAAARKTPLCGGVPAASERRALCTQTPPTHAWKGERPGLDGEKEEETGGRW